MQERNLLPDEIACKDDNGLMKWIKEVILDVLVTIVILAAVMLKIDWLAVLVVGYSGLILFARTIVVLNKSSNVRKKISGKAPDWFFHLSYAFNSIFLLANSWWFTGIAWVGIWLLSWYNLRATKK